MKRILTVLIGLVALAVVTPTALSVDDDPAATDYEKMLDQLEALYTKFLEDHPDSEKADVVRGMLTGIYGRYGSEEWFKKRMDKVKAFIATLEEKEETRMSKFLRGKVLDLEIVGNPPPAFETTDLEGKPLTLENYKGKVLLIDFWATWCRPCVQEIPNVVAVHQKYKDKGFDVLGISLDRAGMEEKLKTFIVENKMPWRQVYDGGHWQAEIAQLYGVSSIPKTYLLDREGKVVKVGARGDDLDRAVAALLGDGGE